MTSNMVANEAGVASICIPLIRARYTLLTPRTPQSQYDDIVKLIMRPCPARVTVIYGRARLSRSSYGPGFPFPRIGLEGQLIAPRSWAII